MYLIRRRQVAVCTHTSMEFLVVTTTLTRGTFECGRLLFAGPITVAPRLSVLEKPYGPLSPPTHYYFR